MVDWRNQNKCGMSRPEFRRIRTRSNYRSPVKHCWQATVPAWEKQFCAIVGSFSWKDLVEIKKCNWFYENVVMWNDSAGEEAFHNAKKRFWAALNDLPCDIPLPDPDLYIDEIDWNPVINEDMVLELEQQTDIGDDNGDKDESALILSNAISMDQPLACTGWGDEWKEVDEKSLKKCNEIIDAEWPGWDVNTYWDNAAKLHGMMDCGRDVVGWKKNSNFVY